MINIIITVIICPNYCRIVWQLYTKIYLNKISRAVSWVLQNTVFVIISYYLNFKYNWRINNYFPTQPNYERNITDRDVLNSVKMSAEFIYCKYSLYKAVKLFTVIGSNNRFSRYRVQGTNTLWTDVTIW